MSAFTAAKPETAFPAGTRKTRFRFRSAVKVKRLFVKMMRNKLFEKIDLAASKIKPYEGFIFLCGGPTDVTSHHPISIRDAIYKELAKNPKIQARIKVAEDFNDWSHDSIYRDLVAFERHLAELSSVIVLAVESAGSIAELGLFSIITGVQNKLLVFIESSHYQSSSFIKHGPIAHLERLDNKANCQIWLKNENSKSIFDPAAAILLQTEMVDAILERVCKTTPARIYEPSSWLDNALLLCDLINLNSALTIREIRDLFSTFGIERQENEVRQMLFILEKVQMIEMRPKGEQRFFVSVDSHQFLQFHHSEKYFDLDRFRSDLLAEYSKNDKKRFRVIQESRNTCA